MLDELISLTSGLIRCPSTATRPQEVTRCARLLTAWLDKHGIAHQFFEHEAVPSILISGPERDASVTLLCHFDVVEGSEAAFTPHVKDGRLYGRGSADDKYACALSLMLYRDHLAELLALGKGQADMPFMLLLTGDEEIGGRNGALTMAPMLRTQFCMALDSGPHQILTVKQKGYLRLRLECTGKAAHGAYPWMGDNAALALARDCLALERFFAVQKGQSPQDEADHWHPTCTVARMEAGKSANQVPDKAHADLDIRYTERDDPDALIKALQAAVTGTLTETSPRGFPVQAGSSPWLDKLLQHMPGVTLGHAHGACDSRHFGAMGIPCVAWGADNEDSPHMESEHLVLESARVVYDTLDKYFRAIR